MGNTLGAYGYLLWGVKYDLPFKESIQSVLPVVDQFTILTDPRFNDGTLEVLRSLATENDKLTIVEHEIDLNNPGVDGASKAHARSLCQEDILVQIDFDEVFREEDYIKIDNLVQNWSTSVNIVGTGVFNWFNGEYFKMGAAGWKKPRFSVNSSNITHGIPSRCRVFQSSDKGAPHMGKYFYAKKNTDGAGYIDAEGGYSMVTSAFLCNQERFPKDCSDPHSIWIHHYSWYSVVRKWRMKPTWHYFWGILYGQYEKLRDYTVDLDGDPVDFWKPEKSWKPLEDYIPGLIDEMKNKTIKKNRSIEHPAVMKEWVARQSVYCPSKLRGLISEKRINF